MISDALTFLAHLYTFAVLAGLGWLVWDGVRT